MYKGTQLMLSTLSVKKITTHLVVASLITVSCISQKAFGQVQPNLNPNLVQSSYIANKIEDNKDTKVIKLKLSEAGISAGSVLTWGVAGLIQSKSDGWVRLEITGNRVRVVHTTRRTNWLTQFSKWWDHPVRNIAFKPDSCVSNPNCLITGTDDVIELKNGMRVDKGEYKIEYLESDEWKTIAFRVPEKVSKKLVE